MELTTGPPGQVFPHELWIRVGNDDLLSPWNYSLPPTHHPLPSFQVNQSLLEKLLVLLLFLNYICILSCERLACILKSQVAWARAPAWGSVGGRRERPRKCTSLNVKWQGGTVFYMSAVTAISVSSVRIWGERDTHYTHATAYRHITIWHIHKWHNTCNIHVINSLSHIHRQTDRHCIALHIFGMALMEHHWASAYRLVWERKSVSCFHSLLSGYSLIPGILRCPQCYSRPWGYHSK